MGNLAQLKTNVMLCKCRECLEQINGKLTSVYNHLITKHGVRVDTIHDAERYVCFPWNDDAAINGVLVPENIKGLARKLQHRKFFGGNHECPCCHKVVSGGFEFLSNGRPKCLVCNDCVHLEIGVMVGDVVDVEDVCNGKTMSVSIQQGIVGNRLFAATPNSPFGKGLLGKKIGETTEIETPRKKVRLRITSIC